MKYIVPFSVQTSLTLTYAGKEPDPRALRIFKAFITLMEAKKYQLCEKHPEAGRYSNGMCSGCAVEDSRRRRKLKAVS